MDYRCKEDQICLQHAVTTVQRFFLCSGVARMAAWPHGRPHPNLPAGHATVELLPSLAQVNFYLRQLEEKQPKGGPQPPSALVKNRRLAHLNRLIDEGAGRVAPQSRPHAANIAVEVATHRLASRETILGEGGRAGGAPVQGRSSRTLP